METILAIIDSSGDYEGYTIKTDKQEIEILISNTQQCCESYGIICSDDNFDDYIGTELLSITEVAQSDIFEYDYNSDSNTIFVNVETSNGTLQFNIYNSHNGYYGHDVIVKSSQLNISESL